MDPSSAAQAMTRAGGNYREAIISLAFLVIASPGQAQLPSAAMPAPPFGARVRLETTAVTGRQVTGRLNEVNQGFVSVALAAGNRQQGSAIIVPWSRISSISHSMGHDRRDGAAMGALFGLGASLVVYPALTNRGPEMSPGASPLVPAVISFGVLPLAGAAVGWFSGPERWRPLSWRPTQDTVMLEGEATRLRVARNTEVLVRTGSRWIKARVVDTDGDTLVVRTSAKRVALDWPSVSQMRVRQGRSRTRGAALGLSLMGGVTIAMLFSDPPGTTGEKRTTIGRNALAGAVVGALVGWPAWTRVPIPVR
jgi:hypothetical protein